MCHEMSCSSCRRRSSAVPFLHIAPSVAFRSAPCRPRRRRPGRSQAAGPFLRAYPARPPARVSAGAVRAPDCPREAEGGHLPPVVAPAKAGAAPVPMAERREPRAPEDPLPPGEGRVRGRFRLRKRRAKPRQPPVTPREPPPGLPRKRGRRRKEQAGRFMEDPQHCVMTCHVPHAAAEALQFRSCISFLHRVPFHSLPSAPPPAWPPSSGGTLFARVSCMRACARPRVSAGAVRAPDCARETAGALSLSVPAGAFLRAPALASLSRKAERRPREPPLSAFIIHHFSSSQAPWRTKCEFFLPLPEDGRTPPFVMPGLDPGESRGPALVFGAASTARRRRVRRRWRSRLRYCRR